MEYLINIFGGPGVGKSVLAAELYIQFSKKNICSEYVGEFAKELVWSKRLELLSNQVYVTSGQIAKMAPLGQCHVVITDSPVLLGLAYSSKEALGEVNSLIANFRKWKIDKKICVKNIYLKRDREKFEQNGRIHNLQESIEKDNQIMQLLVDNNIDFKIVSNEIEISHLLEILNLRFEYANSHT